MERTPRRREPIYVVEGFKACLWLIQHGYRNTVALMGSFLTRRQFDLLCLLAGGAIILLLDNDAAGRLATYKIGKWLFSAKRKVEICSYHPAKAEEPDALDAQELKETIGSRREYARWLIDKKLGKDSDAH